MSGNPRYDALASAEVLRVVNDVDEYQRPTQVVEVKCLKHGAPREFYIIAATKHQAFTAFTNAYPNYGISEYNESGDGLAYVKPDGGEINAFLIVPDVSGIIAASNAMSLITIYPPALVVVEQLLEDLYF